MANKSGGRKRLLAIMEILKNYSDNETHLTSDDIRLKLQEIYHIDADRRSIREDVLSLIEFEYADDASKHVGPEERGAFYTAHPFEDWELKVLIDGVAQTSFFKPKTLDKIIDGIINLSGPKSRELLADNRPILDYEVDDSDYYLCTNLDCLLNAIKSKQTVSFEYFKLDENKKAKPSGDGHYTVNPYVIAKRGPFYYLVTYKDGDSFIRPFRIDRIRNVEILNNTRRIAPNRLPIGDMTKEIKSYLLNNTDSFTGNDISVEITWDDEASILYDVFGINNVFLKDLSSMKFVIKAEENQGLYNNLLRLGSSLTIIEPQSVKDAYLNIIRNISAKY